MSNLNRAPKGSEQPPLVRIGFCKDAGGEAELTKAGMAPDLIWQRGRGMESLDYALRYFRGRSGVLAVADDLRIFGDTRKAIFAQVGELEAMDIRITDVRDKCSDHLALIQRSLVAISASAGMRNHRTARRRGRMGGDAKRAAEAIRRNVLVDDGIAMRLCASRLTWSEKSEILGLPLSTIQRHYKS